MASKKIIKLILQSLFFMVIFTSMILVVKKVPDVKAQSGSTESSGNQNNSGSSPLLNQTIGDDPDENNYVGLINSTAVITATSGINNGSGESYLDQYFSEPQPDTDEYYLNGGNIIP